MQALSFRGYQLNAMLWSYRMCVFFPSWSCIFVQARPSPVSAIENTMARAALRSARSCDGGVGILLYTPYNYGYISTYNPNSTPPSRQQER